MESYLQYALINTNHSRSPLNYLLLKVHVNSIKKLLASDTFQPNVEHIGKKA